MTLLQVDLERPPKHFHVPEHVGSYGREAADLAASYGLPLDPEQQLLPEAAFAYDATGRMVSTEVGCASPRQNIKTHGGKACSLADLVLFGVPECLWTAHRRDTSDDAFRNKYGTGLADLFENYDDLRRLVAPNGISDSDGEKSITLRPPQAGDPQPSLTFMARSERGGRGISGRRVTYDEALFLKPNMVAAMVPILSAQSMTGQVQVRYLGSPGLLLSATWREIRNRGQAGTDETMAWLDWYATKRPCQVDRCPHTYGTPGCVLDDPALIREANLSVDRRIDIRFVLQTERKSLTPQAYMVERMGWWEDPPNEAGGDLDTTRWGNLVDLDAKRGKDIVYGVDVDADRVAWIAMAWLRPDGHVQVMLDNPPEGDTARVSAMTAPARIGELVANWGGRVMLGGPAADIEGDLPAQMRKQVISGSDFATASIRMEDLLEDGQIHHADQEALNLAISLAKFRPVGTAGERAFQLRNAPGVGPLAAVTRALFGLLFTKAPSPPSPVALEAPSGERHGLTDSIADQVF